MIFDMDGTLIKSSKAITTTVNELREGEFGLAALSEEEIWQIVNDPLREAVFELYGVAGVSAGLRFKFEERFCVNYERFARPFGEALEVVRWAKGAGVKVAVATNAPHFSVEKILSDCKLAEAVDFYIGVGEAVEAKPSPQMLHIVLDEFGLKSGEAVFFGDSQKDFLASQKANIPYANVLWEGEKHGVGGGSCVCGSGASGVKDAQEAISFCQTHLKICQNRI